MAYLFFYLISFAIVSFLIVSAPVVDEEMDTSISE